MKKRIRKVKVYGITTPYQLGRAWVEIFGVEGQSEFLRSFILDENGQVDIIRAAILSDDEIPDWISYTELGFALITNKLDYQIGAFSVNRGGYIDGFNFENRERRFTDEQWDKIVQYADLMLEKKYPCVPDLYK